MAHGGAPIIVQPSSNLPYLTPKPTQAPYPRDVKLTFPQNVMCAMGAGTMGAILARPVYNLHHFYFISLQPHVMPSQTKGMYFFQAWQQIALMRHPGQFLHQTAWFTSMLIVPHIFYPLVNDYVSWPFNGFAAGFLSGALLTVLRHPIDVLYATAESVDPKMPRRFTGPMDVLKTSIKEHPRALLGLYRGFRYAAVASALQFAAVFGLYESLKADFYDAHYSFLPLLCYLSVIAGHTVHYPAHYIKQQLAVINKGKMFGKGGVSAMDYIWEQKRQQGVTTIFTGFFDSKPMISNCGPAIGLYLYDLSSRSIYEKYAVKKV